MESIFLKSEPEWKIDPLDDVFSEGAIKVNSNVVQFFTQNKKKIS